MEVEPSEVLRLLLRFCTHELNENASRPARDRVLDHLKVHLSRCRLPRMISAIEVGEPGLKQPPPR